MLLREVLVKYIENYEALNDYTARTKKVTNILNKVILENEENRIELDVDEQEDYVSVLIYNKISNLYYFALSDYTYIEGAREVFGVLSAIDRQEYYNKLRHIRKKIKWSWKRDVYRAEYVKLIYSLIEEYIRVFNAKNG